MASSHTTMRQANPKRFLSAVVIDMNYAPFKDSHVLQLLVCPEIGKVPVQVELRRLGRYTGLWRQEVI